MKSIHVFFRSFIPACILIFTLVQCSSDKHDTSKSLLDYRLDTLLAKMSMQEKIEQLYYNTDGNERLGIPQFVGSDGPHGIGNKAKGYSCFPTTIAMTASWDQELIFRVGRAISLEQAARKKHRIAGPAIDLLSDPRNGRASETIGEDPFLGGRITEAFMQGQFSTAIFGSIKHYNLNTYEANREQNNYKIDQRSLVEFWSPHWKRAVQDGGAMSVMCSYNLVNGEKSAENYNLIKTLLRDFWGFQYYTMCDWGGFWSTKKAIHSELDFCEGNDLYIKELPGMIADGSIDSSLVENAARNILRTKILSGMIDGQPDVPKSVIDSKEHRTLVYESGLKSLVLLKNKDQILPLNQNSLKTIALIGPNAEVLPLDGHSSSAVVPSYTITVKNALDSILGTSRVKYIQGCRMNDSGKKDFSAAIELAKNSDYVVFVGGLDSTMEGEGYFIGGDRIGSSTRLPGVQNELINELARVNPNIILVVISGGTCNVNPVLKNVKALIYAFYPGQEAGYAIADVLLGNYNPSGKLPVSIPKNDEQLPATDMDFTNVGTEGVGYRWYDSQKIQPEFAFGFGLSYTSFHYSNLRLSSENAMAGDQIEVFFDVTNTGSVAGEEVAQLYISTGILSPQIAMPPKQLRGFAKLKLQPGETETVQLSLTPEEFYTYSDSLKTYQVVSGEYFVKVGGSSDNLPLQKTVLLKKAKSKPDLLVKNIRTIPAFPKQGDKVVFLISLMNRGTAATIAGDLHQVSFYVDGAVVASYSSKALSIPTGGMELICAEGINGEDWIARDGIFEVTAIVDFKNSLKETNENNNRYECLWKLPDGKILPKEYQPDLIALSFPGNVKNLNSTFRKSPEKSIARNHNTIQDSNVILSAEKINGEDSVNVSIDITNTGTRHGDEVEQLYIRDLVSTVTRPVKELKDFKRVSLEKGETKTLSFTITPEKLQFYNLDMKRIVEPGMFEVMVGGNSAENLKIIFEVLN